TSANRLLRSVTATDGCPSSAQRRTRSGIRIVESTSEYSLWTWRWTKRDIVATAGRPGQGRCRAAPGQGLTPAGAAMVPGPGARGRFAFRSEEHTSELQSRENLVCRLLLEKKKRKI